MKIRLISDVHHEFDRGNHHPFIDSLPNEGVDVLVIAGDLATGDLISECIRLYCDRFKNVIYVMGNHCAWKSSIEKRIAEFTALDDEIENFHFLENRRIEIDGQGFVGCTLWFREDLRYTYASWIDFRFVDGGCHAIFEQNKKSVEYLEKHVQKNDIVITHHLPSRQCVHPRWVSEPSNCYFVCEMDHVMKNNKPAAWLFGHTHDVINAVVEGVHCMCNPRGYPHEGVDFDPDFIIDTDWDKVV